MDTNMLTMKLGAFSPSFGLRSGSTLGAVWCKNTMHCTQTEDKARAQTQA